MGFKQWLKGETEAQKRAKEFVEHSAHWGGLWLANGEILADGKKYPVAGAQAVFENGVQQSRATLTRIGAGAILFGPAGAVVGGLLKKDKSKCYVVITLADGNQLIAEGPAKEQKQAMEFAAKITTEGAI